MQRLPHEARTIGLLLQQETSNDKVNTIGRFLQLLCRTVQKATLVASH